MGNWGSAKARIFVILATAALAAGCETTPEDKAAIDDAFDHSDIPTAPSAPVIPITEITGCRVERFTQPEATIAEKLDLLFVFDTSASLNAERGRVADGIDAFIAELPPSIDLRIAVMPAHGPKSSWAGKLFRRNSSEPWVLDSKVHTLTQIRSILKDKLTKNQPQDNESDGGEMGLYSLTRGMDADRVVLAQSQGFFRSDAALALTFLADENDICAVYPAGVTPLVDPQGVENKAIRRGDCTGITQNNLLTKLKVLKGSYPLTVGGVIYNNVTTVPREDENEFGYGYFEFIQYSNGITIDMADASYRTGLSNFGNRASVALNLKTEFEVATTAVSSASVYVLVDGAEVPAQRSENDENRIVLTASAGISRSTIDITYCDLGEDTAGPVLALTKPSLTPKLGENDVAGTSDEPLSQITLNGQVLTISEDRKSFSGKITFNQVGVTKLIWAAVDLKGNRSKVAQDAQVQFWEYDAPALSTTLPSSTLLTRARQFSFSVSVGDASSTETVIHQNGREIKRSFLPVIGVDVQLDEGINFFSISSTDVYGNTSGPIQNSYVVLDTSAPLVQISSPISGSIISSLVTPISGVSNEPILSATVNGIPLTVGTDLKTFSGSFSFQTSGNFTLTLQVSDQLGNIASKSVDVTVMLEILNGALVSVSPNPDGSRLDIIGAPGASKPGISIKATSGFLNSSVTTSAADGSFLLSLGAFQSAAVTATDAAAGKTKTVSVSWGSASTLLSGSVRDTNDTPLVNATISLAGTTVPSVKTDANGVFKFTQPVSGDQRLIVDGSTVPVVDINGVTRKFSKTYVSISIGLNQSNVLQRPIYLVPILLDGTQVQISTQTGGFVQNAHAPGVSLNIPTSSIRFPDGAASGTVSMTTISSDVATIPPPGFSVPDQVIALEPSGTTFSKRVAVSAPNVNGFAAGTHLVVMSHNSSSGNWEIDGKATVSADQSTIATDADSGISHFSEIYFSPFFLPPEETSASDNPLTDSFNGTLSKTVALPSFKVLGSSYTPKLIYKSSWAKPNAFISNVLDFTSLSVNIRQSQTGERATPYAEGGSVNYSSTIHARSSFVPRLITAQFTTPGETSDLFKFNGNPHLPIKTVVSYLTDLKDPVSDEFLSTGVYPYSAKYQIHFDHLVVGTQSIRTFWSSGPTVQNSLVNSKTQLDEVFPKDLSGSLVVVNETKSAVGKGWKIGGLQRVANPSGERVLVEEADGSQTTFTIKNSMQTVYEFPKSTDPNCHRNPWDFIPCPFDFPVMVPESATLQNWPFLHITRGYYAAGNPPPLEMAILEQVDLASNHPWSTPEVIAESSLKPGSTGILSDGTVLQVDLATHTINKMGLEGNVRVLGSGTAGFNGDNGLGAATRLNTPKTIIPGLKENTFVFADYGNNRVRLVDLTLGTVKTVAGNGQLLATDIGDGGPATQASLNHPSGLAYDSIGNLYISTANNVVRKVDTSGNISTFAGSPQGVLTDSIIAGSARFSNPNGLVVDGLKQFLYIADTGHNRIVRVDFNTMMATTVAGNGSASDSSYGQTALQGGLSAPTQVALDPDKNLLILDSGNFKVKQVNFQNSSSLVPIEFIGSTQTLPGAKQYNDGSWAPTFVRNMDGTFYRSYRDGSTVNFNAKGLMVQSYDRGIKTFDFTYDGDGNLTSVVDSKGRSITYSYTGSQLRSITDPAGRTTNLSHDPEGQLSRITFPDGTTRGFSYDASGLMQVETDQRGFEYKYSYNQFDRLNQVTLPNGAVPKLSDAGTATALNNATGSETAVALDLGTAPGSAANTISDPNGNLTTVAKDYRGFVEVVVDPKGNTTQIENNELGQPKRVINPDDSVISFSYNSWNDRISQKNESTQLVTSQTYDAAGNVLTSTNGRGLTTVYEYFDNNRLKSKTDPMGHKTSFTYNLLGQLLSQTDYLGHKIQYGYDVVGNLVTITDPMSRVTTRTFDLAGNILTSTDANTHTTRYDYDKFNRVASVTTPKSEKTIYTYLANGQIDTIKDALGQVTTFGYDEMGNLISRKDPLGFLYTYAYDKNGNVIHEVDPNGSNKAYEYDAANNLVKKTFPDNVVHLDYNFRKNPVQVWDNFSKVAYEYDQSGRLRVVASEGLGSLSNLPKSQLVFTLDGDGNRTGLSDSLGSSSYSYDDAGRLTAIVNPQGEIYGYNYNDVTGVVTMSRPGSTSIVTSNGNLENLSISHKRTSDGSTIASYSLVRDDVGNIEEILSNSSSRIFSYDENNQIVAASNPEAPLASLRSESFAFDAIFNRTSDQDGIYSHDAKGQRLEQDYRYQYFYDNNGNLIKKQSIVGVGDTSQYSYDSQNRLVSLQLFVSGSGVPVKTVNYFYDALDRRVRKEVFDALSPNDPIKTYARTYVYDAKEILFEFDGNNSSAYLARYTHSGLRTDDVLAVNVSSAGQAVQLAQGAGSYQYVKDNLSSVAYVTDNSGVVSQRYIYSLYGDVLAIRDGAGADVTALPTLRTSYAFAGREYEAESGIYYSRARYYDPKIGRFLGTDPAGYSGVSINRNRYIRNIGRPSANLYRYAEGNPLRFIDPDGLFSLPSGSEAYFGGMAEYWPDIIDTGMYAGMAYSGAALGILVASSGIITSATVAYAANAGMVNDVGLSVVGGGMGIAGQGSLPYTPYSNAFTGALDVAFQAYSDFGTQMQTIINGMIQAEFMNSMMFFYVPHDHYYYGY